MLDVYIAASFYFQLFSEVVEELSKIIENPDLKKTLENLAKNYENFDQIWSLESLNEFAEANKKAILRNLPKSEIPVQRR